MPENRPEAGWFETLLGAALIFVIILFVAFLFARHEIAICEIQKHLEDSGTTLKHKLWSGKPE